MLPYHPTDKEKAIIKQSVRAEWKRNVYKFVELSCSVQWWKVCLAVDKPPKDD